MSAVTDLLALLLSTLSGLLHPGVNEQQLEAELARVVLAEQPAPLEEVKVDAAKVTATGADKVEFKFTEITLDELLVSRATFTVTGVQKSAAGGPGSPPHQNGSSSPKLSVKGITWSAAITDSALTTALRAGGGKMKDATVTIAPAGLTLRGKWPLGFTKVGYGVTGNLSVDGSLLNFSIDKSDVSGIGVPGGINNLVEKEVNPVYDFASFAARSEKELKLARERLNYDFKLTITKIVPYEGHIIVYGSA